MKRRRSGATDTGEMEEAKGAVEIGCTNGFERVKAGSLTVSDVSLVESAVEVGAGIEEVVVSFVMEADEAEEESDEEEVDGDAGSVVVETGTKPVRVPMV